MMKTTAFTLLLSLTLTLPALSQDKEPEKEPEKTIQEEPKKKDKFVIPGQPGRGQDKILEIIEELEATLAKVEELLFEASTRGVGELQENILANLDKLLEDASRGQAKVMADIDELIANAPKNGGGTGGPSRKKPKSEKDKKKGQEKREQEAKREQEKQGDQKKDGEENNSQKEQQKGDQKTANQKPKDKTGAANSKPDIVDRWGNLPPLIKDRISKREFMNFPPAYRDKLMKYYKRLNHDDR